MKKLLLILIISLSFGSISMADTIDFWHIYYNNVKVQECNGYMDYVLILKLDSINAEDSITVRYFRDTPCEDCSKYLHVRGAKTKRDFLFFSYGFIDPMIIRIKFIKEHFEKTGDTIYDVNYCDEKSVFGTKAIQIFKIKLE